MDTTRNKSMIRLVSKMDTTRNTEWIRLYQYPYTPLQCPALNPYQEGTSDE